VFKGTDLNKLKVGPRDHAFDVLEVQIRHFEA